MISRQHRFIAPVLFLLLFLFLPTAFFLTTAKSASAGEALDIVLDLGKRPTPTFYLYSKCDGVVIYQENNSWGYGCRSLLAKGKASGTKYEIKRLERNWKHNAPATKILNTNHGLETEFDLCDGTWYCLPKLQNKDAKDLELRPVFEITKKDAAVAKTWSGKIIGRSIDFSIDCPEKLNQY